MRPSMRLSVIFTLLGQTITLLSCLLVYATSAHAIMVKFGTKDGPIEPPPPPVPSVPPPKPYRSPAPVWEDRTNDEPDPNAHWRPQPFIPRPLYTHIYSEVATQQPLNNAQRFVNSYLPKQHQPIPAAPITSYFKPTQNVGQLSSQSLPGFGIRYFVPAYVNELEANKQQNKRQEDARLNEVETNEVADSHNSNSDLQWNYEKEAGKRTIRNSQEGTYTYVPRPFVYQFPAFVGRQQ